VGRCDGRVLPKENRQQRMRSKEANGRYRTSTGSQSRTLDDERVDSTGAGWLNFH